MKIEDQVCSLDLSIKLKELGVKQNGYFCHVVYDVVDDNNHDLVIDNIQGIVAAELYDGEPPCIIASAFSVAELLEIFPDHTEPHRWHFGMERKELREQCGGKYYCVTDARDYPHDDDFYSDNPADCLANAIIMLIESKFIEVKK